MACKGCGGSGCPSSALLACFQFMLCPTDVNGNNKDCSKAPRIVSNSWGGGQGSTFYASVVNAWRAAGIIPVFSNGNAGRQGCGTANSPADLPNVIGVGASDINNALADFSSRGPARSGRIKPDISAPGVNVISAGSASDNSIVSMSGTSMAAPHLSGVVALMLQAKPDASYDAIYRAMTSSASRNIRSGNDCSSGSFPNNGFGHGIVNVPGAISSLGGGLPPPPGGVAKCFGGGTCTSPRVCARSGGNDVCCPSTHPTWCGGSSCFQADYLCPGGRNTCVGGGTCSSPNVCAHFGGKDVCCNSQYPVWCGGSSCSRLGTQCSSSKASVFEASATLASPTESTAFASPATSVLLDESPMATPTL